LKGKKPPVGEKEDQGIGSKGNAGKNTSPVLKKQTVEQKENLKKGIEKKPSS